MPSIYNKKFFNDLQEGSYKSAQEILPILFELIQPKSVLDVGCGIGTWLNVFKNEYKVPNVTGLDGDYVNRNMLRIEEEEFIPFDVTKKYDSDTKFDLAISLEVGEHLPEKYADNLIDTLTSASDIIMFSSAVPGQIGTNHINEQYTEYWADKFIKKGFTPIDYFRKRIWNNKNIEWWYKQNIILYIKDDLYNTKFSNILYEYKENTDPEFLTRIHPDMVNYFVGKFLQLQTYSGFARYKLYPLKKMF